MCTVIELWCTIPGLIEVIYNALIFADNFSKGCDIEFLICLNFNTTCNWSVGVNVSFVEKELLV